MFKVIKVIALSGAIILACNGLLGCSGTTGNPTAPANVPDTHRTSPTNPSERILWGLWNIHFDIDNLTLDIEPVRNAYAHFNIIHMLLPPECDNCLLIKVNSFDPVTRILDADITLRNPYQLFGHDVRGIFYTLDYGHELTNPDDWTGLWDIPGGDYFNPFRAYAKGEPYRIFTPMAVHTEKYLLYIPQPPEWGKITFSADASWPGNCKEPYSIDNFIQETLYDTSDSYAVITIDVKDWQDDVSEVTLTCEAVTGPDSVQLEKISGDVWGADIQNAMAAPEGLYKAKFTATSADSGLVALYDFVTITITEKPIIKTITVTQPNGGEEWDVSSSQSILWSSTGPIDNVKIEYSEDGGTSFPHIIIGSTPNDGSFTWNPIPDTPTDQAIVRITDVDEPGIFDVSDNPFTIKKVPKSITVLVPNGGEEWKVTTYHDITWDTTGAIANVKIEYFKDDDYDLTKVLIIDSTSNDGSYTWNPIPDDLSSTLKVRISDQSDPAIYDDSDEFFSIIPPPDGWARTWGGNGDDISYGVATDDFGNIYVTARFQGTVDFDPGYGMDYHTSSGEYDAYLSKFDSGGNFQWARTWGGSDWDGSSGVATDDSGYIYVTGFFVDIADLDPGPGIDEHISNGSADLFLTKFDTNGDFQWAFTWGGSGLDQGSGVATCDLGNIYVSGMFTNTVDFDPSSGIDEHASNGSDDVFLSKFNQDGNFQWARTWGGSNSEAVFGLSTGGSSNIYITGYFRGTVDLDPGLETDYHTSNGSVDVYLTRFDSNGNFQWARTWGGNGVDQGNGVSVDSSSDIYVSGWFRDTVDFNPGPEIDEISSNGYSDVFLSKFNSSGDFQWARTWGNTTMDEGYGVVTDGSSNIYITGRFIGTVDFDPGPGTDEHTTNGYIDVFLSKFSTDGNFQWARTWGDGTGYGVATDASDNIYVTGYFYSTVDFDPGPGEDEHTSNGYNDAFLSKFPPDGNW